ncbi:hypothetical protein RJY75_26240 [Escherichia coli]|uniref:hypothetical protein n=1 Tax=Escherichia coli TaxID=562 RepID=UPI00287A8A46|nr:hypothetical protein [Escherichia coli]MDS4101220.1 hypothetical protein [Escherichia coli]
MKNRLKLLHVTLLDLLLSWMVIVVSFYYAAASLFGVFNPIMLLMASFMDYLAGKKGFFPQSIHEYSSWWDRLEFSTTEMMQFVITGILLCLVIYTTFLATFNIAGYFAGILRYNYIKYILGARFLRLYEKMQNRKGKVIARQQYKESEKNALNDASFEHYSKWKAYYKSDMSFDEWKNKVMNDKNN